MIRAKPGIDGPPVTFAATVEGVAIYLDNFALVRLAKDPPARKRFLDAVHTGSADLLFSITNAAELTGPQGGSALAVRDFLDELGPHWFPVTGIDPKEIADREIEGERGPYSFVSTDLLKNFASWKIGRSSDCGKLIDLSESFFRLGSFVEFLGTHQREQIARDLANLDAALIGRINTHRLESEGNPAWLDEKFPELPFNPLMPATFAYVNLIRTLILEAKAYQLKKGDGADFCHAVVGAAFASVATLDKQWKRRVETLRTPNKLARIYYLPEIDDMLTAVESWLQRNCV